MALGPYGEPAGSETQRDPGSYLRLLQGAVASCRAAVGWRPPSPPVSSRIPYTTSPRTECMATDLRTASPSLGIAGMSYQGRNAIVGNSMPWAWPQGQARAYA